MGKKFEPNKEEFQVNYEKLSLTEASKLYGVDRHTVTKFAKELGIYKDRAHKLSAEQKQYALDNYLAKTSYELADELGVRQSSIANLWSRNGLSGKQKGKVLYSLNENYFSAIESEHQAYWLGFLASDGCVSDYKGGQKRIILALKSEDEEILFKFMEDINSDYPIGRKTRKNPNGKDRYYSTAAVLSDKMAEDLSRYNIVPRKTYSFVMPDNLPDKLYPAFFRGYFDGDGSISRKIEPKKLGDVNVTISGFENNLTAMQEYLSKKGITSFLHYDNRYPKKSHTSQLFCHICFRNKTEKSNFLHYIYDDASIYLERKYLLAQKFFELIKLYPKTFTKRRL